MPAGDIEKSLRRAGRGGIHDVLTEALPAPPRHFKGGQFIPAALWNKEKSDARAALPVLLRGFGESLSFLLRVQEQNVAVRKIAPDLAMDAEVISGRMQATIRENYLRAYDLGKRAAGNLLGVTGPDESVLTRARTDEYTYLASFLKDTDDGRGRMPYTERMQWYAYAAREIFHLGFVHADPSATRRVEWVLGATDQHCPDCVRLAGVWSGSGLAAEVTRSGMVPQAGSLACRGYHCRCALLDISVVSRVTKT